MMQEMKPALIGVGCAIALLALLAIFLPEPKSSHEPYEEILCGDAQGRTELLVGKHTYVHVPERCPHCKEGE